MVVATVDVMVDVMVAVMIGVRPNATLAVPVMTARAAQVQAGMTVPAPSSARGPHSAHRSGRFLLP